MIEVFKTNICDVEHSHMVIQLIENAFQNYKVNFDLDDCDKILRVKSTNDAIESYTLIALLKRFDFEVEILQEDSTYAQTYIK
jgi:hypothetical protein